MQRDGIGALFQLKIVGLPGQLFLGIPGGVEGEVLARDKQPPGPHPRWSGSGIPNGCRFPAALSSPRTARPPSYRRPPASWPGVCRGSSRLGHSRSTRPCPSTAAASSGARTAAGRGSDGHGWHGGCSRPGRFSVPSIRLRCPGPSAARRPPAPGGCRG